MTRPLLFCDLETDGLRSPWIPGGRRIWEIAVILRQVDGTEEAFHLFIRLDDLRFDPSDPGEVRRQSLDIGGFSQRHPQLSANNDDAMLVDYREAARIVQGWMVDQPVLVGAVPSFDAESLLHLLHTTGQLAATWAMRLVCVWSLAAGRLGIEPHLLDRELIGRHLGIAPDDYCHHRALDDARWARDVYDAVLSH